MEILVYLCIVFVLISTKKRDLAQLVAHVVRDDEVAGSSPVIPTDFVITCWVSDNLGCSPQKYSVKSR